MKKSVLFCVLISACCLPAWAQQYSIDWYKVAGGGGTSTGGVYSVSGTIGQHDAGGPMTGGNYSLTGGFWALSPCPNSRRADAVYQPFRQHGDGVLAGCVRLEFAAERQSVHACRLVSQRQLDNVQRHEFSDPHVTDGKSVLPVEAIASQGTHRSGRPKMIPVFACPLHLHL